MIPTEIISLYTSKTPPKRRFYEQSIKVAKEVKAHISTLFPRDVLDKARPNEFELHKKYREEVYEPVNTNDFSKIVNAFKKIRRSEDFKVKFEKEDTTFEAVKKYVDETFPFFKSLLNWQFNFALRKGLIDPNAVCVVYPKNFKDEAPETHEPYTFIYDSSEVLSFDKNLLVILLKEKSMVKVGENTKRVGNKFIFMDGDEFIFMEQKGRIEANEYDEFKITHELGHITAFKLGGIIKDIDEDDVFYESFIADCLPYWREAVRRYSDHQIDVVNHVHPQGWQYSTDQCQACKGTGYKKDETGNIICPRCKGHKYMFTLSPGDFIKVKPVKTGPNEIATPPVPPIGYIDKPIEGTEFILKDYERNKIEALRALNLEYLSFEPLLNSGIAKDFDRQEINATFYNFASHLIEDNLIFAYQFVIDWLLINDNSREKYYPTIQIPRKYDILSTEILRTRARDLKNDDFNPFIVAKAQKEYYLKEYGEDDIEFKIFTAGIKLDPLFGVSDTDKVDYYGTGGCTQVDYFISNKLPFYVRKAFEANNGFFDMKLTDQMEVLKQYASEDIAELNRLRINDDGEL